MCVITVQFKLWAYYYSYNSYNKGGFRAKSRFKTRRLRDSSLYSAQWTVTLTIAVTSDLENPNTLKSF